jgi:hypothetical protein
MKSKVDQIKVELREFIENLLSKGWDIIVPIMRKGLLMSDPFLRAGPSSVREKVRLLPLDPREQLRRKTILILDDKAWRGATMMDNYRAVLSRYGEPDNVKAAVFLENRACRFRIDYSKYQLQESQYVQKETVLNAYYASLCQHLDPDHLAVNGKLVSSAGAYHEFPALLEKKMVDFGSFYSQESLCSLWGRTKFAIADLPTDKLGLGELRSFLGEEGVVKIRFCLESDGRTSITPVVFGLFVDKIKCRQLLSTQLCQIASFRPVESYVCRDCVDFNITTRIWNSFAENLRERMKGSGFSIEVTDATWPELEYRYRGTVLPFLERLRTKA